MRKIPVAYVFVLLLFVLQFAVPFSAYGRKSTPLSRVSIELGQPANSGEPLTLVIKATSRIAFHNGYDLYGIDMCIDLCANLKNSCPKIGFVFCLPALSLLLAREYII